MRLDIPKKDIKQVNRTHQKVKCKAETKATRVSSGIGPENTLDKMSLLIVLKAS